MELLKVLRPVTMFARKAQPLNLSLADEARAMVTGGLLTMPSFARKKALVEFYEKLNGTRGDYQHAIRALRVLSDAGCKEAHDYRCKVGTGRMGNQFFESRDYIPYVIEHSVAYINGRDDVLAAIAFYCENEAANARERNGVLGAVNFLKDMIGEGERRGDTPDWFRSLHFSHGTIDELRRLWNEHPDIVKILRGDLMVFRAANTPDTRLALAYFREARGNGVGRMDLNLHRAYEIIFQAPAVENT